MLLLGLLVALSLVAMTGVFGARDGAYRGKGLIAGIVLLVVAGVLLLSHTVK